MIYDNGIYRELTEEENAQITLEAAKREYEYWQNTSYENAVHSKIRERYSESQEFAILRQKDEKPEEYAEYYAYCEECKAFVKEKKSNI